MLLSYEELLALAARGVIQNVDTDYINSASIDITLGKKILLEADPMVQPKKIVSLRERTPLNMVEMDCTSGFVLRPGDFILAQSEQVFNLPNDISAEYKLKSSMARIGINHALAGWCDAGWNGSVLTLELYNWTKNHDIVLTAGDRIGQMIFFKHRAVPEDRSYAARGRYNNDKTVEGMKK
jgi:dCTP deaminase